MTKVGETWIVIWNFPNYSVSTFGRVMNNRTFKMMKIENKYVKGRPKNQHLGLLNYKGKSTKVVHRLMTPFMPPQPTPHHTVDHIDRNPFNNHISNLRWATHKEQIENSSVKKKHLFKISPELLHEMYLRSKNETLKEISKDYGMYQTALNSILKYIHPDY